MTNYGRWRWGLITLAAVLGAGLTASLGFWQLNRAAQKQALSASMNAQSQLPALTAPELTAANTPARLKPILHRKAQLQGRWLAEKTVFLDNRQMNAKPGFYVVTPLQLDLPPGASPAVVLVQRGWIPRNFVDRKALAPIQTPEGRVQVQGRVAAEPAQLYAFEGPDLGPIRQNLTLAAFRKETQLPLLELTVVQDGAPSEGLLRQWAQVDSGVAKHHGYAFQWFGLAGLIALLYVWFQIVRPLLASRRPV